MRKMKIAAFAAALCMMTGTVPAGAVYTTFPAATAADETEANRIEMEVGTSVPITSEKELPEQPEWKSDNEKVAKVDQTGTITAVGEGTAHVYAVFSDSVYKFEVVVKKPAEEEPQTVDIGKATLDNTQYVATPQLDGLDNTKAVWSSTDEKVAKVDKKGTITATGKGECQIKAVYGNTTYVLTIISSYDPDAQLTSTPGEAFIGSFTLTDKKPNQKIEATLPEGLTAVWSSTDESVAVVDQEGNVTAKGSGSCRIYADVSGQKYYVEVTSTYSGKNGSTLMTVTLTNEKPSQKVALNNVEAGTKLTWKSTDTSVATVSSEGVITAVGKGKCQVIVYVGETPYTIEVDSTYDPAEEPSGEYTLTGIGTEMQLNMSGKPELMSMDVNVATVSETGLIRATGIGETEIIADFGGRITKLKIKVVPATVYGDANEDGKITVSDAVAILQFIANKEKYPLTGQGAINADCDGEKGITGTDAIAVQKKDAGVVDTLPLKPVK
jgi:hypothetical protein